MPTPDAFHEALQRVVTKYGQTLIADPERCEPVLRTVCGEYEHEVTALMAAVGEQVPANLLAWKSRLPISNLLAWLAKSLAHKRGLDPATARWAVESCAWALNVISTAELTTAFPAPASAQPEPPPPTSAAPDALAASASTLMMRRHKSRILSRYTYTSKLNTPPLTLAPGVTMEFVRVPPGEFLMGSHKTQDSLANSDEAPQHIVRLGEFLMGRLPVTNAQYAAFIQSTGSRAPEHWPEGGVPPALDQHPVVNVSWDEANAFCRWASGVTQTSIRLPTEAEWEKAARGIEGKIWPWGNEPPDKTRCNFNKHVGNTTPVGYFGRGAESPFGCIDMAGNVWEWTASLFKPYPFHPEEEAKDSRSREARVVRGGAWDCGADAVRTPRRARADPTTRLYTRGFRCAR
jgi:formylglycine-generating enzyme required for sulfatase activity